MAKDNPTGKVSSEKLNELPFKTRIRPYLIVAPALIITRAHVW